jgi:hypothetical protein
MKSPKLILAVTAIVAALLPSNAAAQAEVFNFPQNHDTVFGDQIGAVPNQGNFAWWLDGQGVRGRRQTTNIERLEAFGFNLVFEPSCMFAGAAMFLDVYVNDRQLDSVPMPAEVFPCNSDVPPIQKQYDLSANPILGLTGGKEFEVRFQLRGTSSIPCCGLAVFYRLNTSSSTVAFAGTFTDDGGDDDPPPPPPPPVDEHGNVIARIDQAEGSLIGHIGSDGTTTRTAIQSVREALGVVEGNLDASIAGAVLKVNSETALGIGNLATQLGLSTQDLALAIKGNGNALEKVQKTLEDKMMPELLKGHDLQQLTQAKVEEVGNSFFEKTLEQALSAGTGMLSLFSGGTLLPVAGFLQKSIMSVVNGNLRPDRIAKKAMAEFNRGLKRVKKLFSFNGAFDLPWGDRAAIEAITFGMAAETVDIPEFAVDAAYDALLGPDTEENTAYGAYVWFQRAYQTLVQPDGYGWHDGHMHRSGECLDPRHSKSGAKARLTTWP